MSEGTSMKFNKKVIEIWLKWFAYSFFLYSANVAKPPFEFTVHDWMMVANNIWYALVPVVIAWANPHHALTMTVPTEKSK